MSALNQIAQHLEVEASWITRCEEWAKVWFVVIQGKGARFVSKKVVKMAAHRGLSRSASKETQIKNWVKEAIARSPKDWQDGKNFQIELFEYEGEKATKVLIEIRPNPRFESPCYLLEHERWNELWVGSLNGSHKSNIGKPLKAVGTKI